MAMHRRSLLKLLGCSALVPAAAKLPPPEPEWVIGIDPAIPGGDFGAVAIAEVRSGVITTINIVSAGSGYLGTPTINFTSR